VVAIGAQGGQDPRPDLRIFLTVDRVWLAVGKDACQDACSLVGGEPVAFDPTGATGASRHAIRAAAKKEKEGCSL